MTTPSEQALVVAALEAKIERLEQEQNQTAELLRGRLPDESIELLVNKMQADAQSANVLYLGHVERLVAGMLAVASSALSDGSIDVLRHSMESLELTLKTLNRE